jgi:hypothetical protein
MMPVVDILHTPRGGGKTDKLIAASRLTGYYIVAPTHADCYRIHQRSIAEGNPIPFPLTWHEWVENHYNPYGVRGLYIDDIDRCLAMHSRVTIHAVSGRFED